MDIKQLGQLPSPFYRVTAKALIYDDQGRVLVGKGEEDSDGWEMPGGGWEHNESLEECIRREIAEELGAEVASIGDIKFIYRGRSTRGWMIVRLAVETKLENFDFPYGDMKEARFVNKDELLALDFAADEGTIKNCVDQLWP
jgi:8-oxo-dGTP pyrophosphatase MutT (NUDIX family)